MKLSERVRPISYLKAHAPEIVRRLDEGGGPVVITLRGEAKAVLQDIASYERTQETLALLKILALGQRSVEAGAVSPTAEAFARVRRRVGAPGEE
jgi:prevent-host-death family protein